MRSALLCFQRRGSWVATEADA